MKNKKQRLTGSSLSGVVARLIAAISLAIVSIQLLSAWSLVSKSERRALLDAQMLHETLLANVVPIVSSALWNYNTVAFEAAVRGLFGHGEVNGVYAFKADGKPLKALETVQGGSELTEISEPQAAAMRTRLQSLLDKTHGMVTGAADAPSTEIVTDPATGMRFVQARLLFRDDDGKDQDLGVILMRFANAKTQAYVLELRKTSLLFSAVALAAVLAVAAVFARILWKKAIQPMELASCELAEVAELVASNAAELKQTSTRLLADSSKGAGAMASAAETVEAIRKNSHQVEDAMDEVSGLSGTAKATANQGAELVEALAAATDAMVRANQQASETIGIIENIAFQTNILALNAAVEAARAGEHGKGFSVVAASVRALAQKSAESARIISGHMNESQEKSRSVASQANLARGSLREIVKTVETVTGLAGDVKGLVHQESAGLDQFADSLHTLGNLTQATTQLARQVVTDNEQIGRELQRLQSCTVALDALVGCRVRS